MLDHWGNASRQRQSEVMTEVSSHSNLADLCAGIKLRIKSMRYMHVRITVALSA